MLMSELINAPIEKVIEFLDGKPDFMGEAVARLAYTFITNNPQAVSKK